MKPCASQRVPIDWAEEEFGGCDLPDARLQTRLLSLARDFYARPQANVAQACANRAKTKAAYRFMGHEQTTVDTLLQPHFQSTEAHVRTESVVLAVQDTTSLNYTAHAATGGMGPIGSTTDGPQGAYTYTRHSPSAPRARRWGFWMCSAGRAIRLTSARRRSVIVFRSRRKKASSG